MAKQQRRNPERRHVRQVALGLLLLIAGLALIGAWGGAKARRVWNCADSGMARVRALEALSRNPSLEVATLAGAGSQLRGLQTDLGCVRAEVGMFLPLLPHLSWLPRVGPDVASAPDLLEMAQALVDGGVIAFDALSPMLEEATTGTLDLADAVAALHQAGPALAQAEGALAHASGVHERLAAARLSPRLAGLVAQTGRALPLVQDGVQAARLLPGLMGSQGPQTYLVLAQNDDERRPTGGWISGAGLIRAERGQITALGFHDSYSVDNLSVPHEAPPDSMKRTLWAEMWLFRDSNWSPDFPTAAAVAERILARDQGVTVDGVIAVNQEALRLLVAAMEPLLVPSQPEPITGANVVNVIRRLWTEPQPGLMASGSWEEWEAHRKDIMAELMGSIIDRVQGGQGRVDPSRLAAALWQGLEERHILLYVHDPAVAALLSSRGWDGAIRTDRGDYLQVVDANVGFNKVDPNVARTIEYEVDLCDRLRPQAIATARYRNQSPSPVGECVQQAEWKAEYEQRMVGCLWNYVRFYIPGDARLREEAQWPLPPGSLLSRFRFLDGSPGDGGLIVEPLDSGRAAFGVFLAVAPGEEREVPLAWQLPAGVLREDSQGIHYQLLIQKQSGTSGIPVRVTVHLPSGAQLVMATPEPAAVEPGTVKFQSVLATDQEFEVVFR